MKQDLVLHKLYVTNFRKWPSLLIEIEKPILLVVAPNAWGKTTILEAVYLLATGESFRAQKNEEMISFGSEIGRTAGLVKMEEGESDAELDRLEVMLTRGLVNGKKTPGKLLSINQARKRKKDFVGQFGAVAFRPEDLRLIEGSPGRRRSWLNSTLANFDQEYAQALKNYDQTLLRRNKLLSEIKDGRQQRTALAFWDQSLISNGQVLQQKRADFLAFCNRIDFPLTFKVEYDQSLISTERLTQYAQAEVAATHTLVGPHKDDLIVEFNFTDNQPAAIATYGSRGQQRLAVLWLKICELKWAEIRLKERNGYQKPILLLDDILSELDEDSRQMVIELSQQHQTLMTTTEAAAQELLLKSIPAQDLQIIELTKL